MTKEMTFSQPMSFLAAFLIYPLAFRQLLPHKPTSSHFAESREAVSVLHCSLVTLASLYELYQRRDKWMPSHSSSGASITNISRVNIPGQSSVDEIAIAFPPIITARSALANKLVTIETAYLAQDSLILLVGAYMASHQRVGGSFRKAINWRILGFHHGGLLLGLGTLQWYIVRGKEKGILIILMLMLMNASYVTLVSLPEGPLQPERSY
jgi:hypothetical protein